MMARQVVIVGAGIVGSALAAELTAEEDVEVTVVERGPRGRLVGSTGHAPGFVGVFHEDPLLTALAASSTKIYANLERSGQPGFDQVGGLEVAGSAAGLEALQRRAAAAEKQDLPAQVVDAEGAVGHAPHLVDPAGCAGGVFYPRDGSSDSRIITTSLRGQATASNARFVYDTAVTGIDIQAERVHAVHTTKDRFPADDVVLACGIWGPTVAALAGESLPLVPVGHPYVYGPVHEAPAAATPFVRWPEQHVYARDHGDRLGLGSYDHTPRPVDDASLGASAEQPWPGQVFDAAVDRALDLLPTNKRFAPVERLNGVFAMTADNLPLVGHLGDAAAGFWAAEALWVTHAAGAAHGLAELMTERTPTIDGLDALRPDRFADRPPEELTTSALRLYRDIYATT